MRPDGYRIVWHVTGHRDEIRLLDGDGGSTITYRTVAEAEEAASRRATPAADLEHYVAAYYEGVR